MTSANIFESLVLQTIVAFVSVRIVLNNKLNLQVDTGTGCSPSLIDKLFICTLQSKMHRQILLGEFNLQLPRPIQIKKKNNNNNRLQQQPTPKYRRVYLAVYTLPPPVCRFALSLLSLFFAQCNEDNVEGDGEEDTHTQIQSQGLSLVRFASQSEINTNTNKNRNRSTRHSHRKKRKGKQCKARGETERESGRGRASERARDTAATAGLTEGLFNQLVTRCRCVRTSLLRARLFNIRNTE